MSTSTPSLLDYIAQKFSIEYPGVIDFKLQTIRSQPRRSYALFPHHSISSSTPKVKIWQEEVLSILNLQRQVEEGGGGFVPLCAIEASIYTIPTTKTSILYISKVDTTGLQQPTQLESFGPSPTKLFVTSFLEFHLKFPPHSTNRLRIHVFAKSQDQYLFPGSLENIKQPYSTKKVLNDKELLRWWKSTLSLATTTTTTNAVGGEGEGEVKKFVLIPGMNYLESLPYLPDLKQQFSSSDWIYGHPYSTIPSPLYPSSSSSSFSSSSEAFSLINQIPCFPDDPKSRFLHSLTSSSLNPSGSEGDYDDVEFQLKNLVFTSGNKSTVQQRRIEFEKERERERSRLVKGVKGGVEEWWERMGFRQECCSGVLVGFFVISLDRSEQEEEVVGLETTTTIMSNNGGGGGGGGSPKPYPSSLPHSVFTKLWSEFHNQDYSISSLSSKEKEKKSNLIQNLEKWSKDVERLVRLELGKDNKQHEKGEQTTTTTTIDSGEGEELEGGTSSSQVEKLVQIRNQTLLDQFREDKEKKRKLSTLINDQGGLATTTNGVGGAGGVQAQKVNTLAPRKKKKV